jgi:hypothetical protein
MAAVADSADRVVSLDRIAARIGSILDTRLNEP